MASTSVGRLWSVNSSMTVTEVEDYTFGDATVRTLEESPIFIKWPGYLNILGLVVETLIFLVGIFGNGLLVMSVVLAKALRTPANALIASLAVSRNFTDCSSGKGTDDTCKCPERNLCVVVELLCILFHASYSMEHIYMYYIPSCPQLIIFAIF